MEDRLGTHLKFKVNVTGSADSLLFFFMLVSENPQPLDALSAHDLLFCESFITCHMQLTKPVQRVWTLEMTVL